ncbi:hypothetical protein V1264_024546 [Littorina saxatilis]|uniref:IgGFc-binding protein N-terminal domain-containing protein n=1 Tax=Littorina saxatilis TaxID=31220 RepID=A0AAN9FZ67_9CAEN
MATREGVSLLFCVALCFLPLEAREAVEGREFMVAFMQHNAHESYSPLEQNLFLYISNPGTNTVNVRVEFYDLDTQPTIDLDIAPEATQTVTLIETLMLQGATKHGKSVHVISDYVIQVQAIYELSQQRKSYGGTGVLPMTSLTKDYVAATHCERRYCVLLVLATEDGAEVKVKLRVGPGDDGGGLPHYNNQTYEDGDEITDSLNRGESMQVLCYRCDLTGSWINSSKVVAVFSGGDFTRVSHLGP